MMSVQPNETEKLFEVIYDIRDRVTRIEEGQKRQGQIEEKADAANKTANEALLKSQTNENEIRNVKTSSRWAWGTFFAFMIMVVGASIKLFA
jgi:hypothetical protein